MNSVCGFKCQILLNLKRQISKGRDELLIKLPWEVRNIEILISFTQSSSVEDLVASGVLADCNLHQPLLPSTKEKLLWPWKVPKTSTSFKKRFESEPEEVLHGDAIWETFNPLVLQSTKNALQRSNRLCSTDSNWHQNEDFRENLNIILDHLHFGKATNSLCCWKDGHSASLSPQSMLPFGSGWQSETLLWRYFWSLRARYSTEMVDFCTSAILSSLFSLQA